jgi:hypothetical protein
MHKLHKNRLKRGKTSQISQKTDKKKQNHFFIPLALILFAVVMLQLNN